MSNENGRRLGWVGAGRMGHALAARLLAAGHDVAVYNRTRAKAESLGATVVDAPAELADREVVFTMVAGPDDFKEVVLGPSGVLSGDGTAPAVIVDMTTVSPDASQAVRDEAARRGVAADRGAGQRQPEGGGRGPRDDGRLRPARGVRPGRPAARPARRRRHLRRRRREGPAGEDLPQPDARRRRAVHGRDHRAGREGRHVARRLPGLPQRQRDGLDVHALQDARLREPRLHADLHAAPPAQGLRPRASRPRASSTCRCRSRPPHSR